MVVATCVDSARDNTLDLQLGLDGSKTNNVYSSEPRIPSIFARNFMVTTIYRDVHDPVSSANTEMAA